MTESATAVRQLRSWDLVISIFLFVIGVAFFGLCAFVAQSVANYLAGSCANGGECDDAGYAAQQAAFAFGAAALVAGCVLGIRWRVRGGRALPVILVALGVAALCVFVAAGAFIYQILTDAGP